MPRRLRAAALTLTAALLLAGCGGGSAPTTFDLTAPRDFGRVGASRATLVVQEPTTVQALDSDRVIVRDSSGALSFVGGAQWADRVPKLVQVRLIQTFENGGRVGSVARPGDRITPEAQLLTDIRSFNIDAARPSWSATAPARSAAPGSSPPAFQPEPSTVPPPPKRSTGPCPRS